DRTGRNRCGENMALAPRFSGAVPAEPLQPVLEQDGQGSQDEGDSQNTGNEAPDPAAVDAQVMQRDQGDQCSRDTAGRKPADQFPFDIATAGVNPDSGGLGEGCVKQICAYGGRGRNTEYHDQHRGHQRASAYPGESYDKSDQQP